MAALENASPESEITTLVPVADVPLDALTTGRSVLWGAAWNEFKASPVFGNGFSSFGRYSMETVAALPEYLRSNTTAHMYYLNTLWKGGVLFGLPMFLFIFMAFASAWNAYRRPVSRRWLFGLFGAVIVFAAPSITWDILMVPSAGAMAWFVLGVLGVGYKKKGRALARSSINTRMEYFRRDQA